MAARWQKLLAWLDGQSVRERGLILAVACVAAFFAVDSLGLQPLMQARAALAGERESVEKQVRALRSEAERARDRVAQDPDAPNRARLSELEAKLTQLDRHLAEATVDLIAPEQMPEVLRGLLRAQPALRLVRLESLPVEPLVLDAAGGEAAAPGADAALQSAADAGSAAEQPPAAPVYRHAVALELRGSYAATLAYLEQLESLPWRFFWDHLEYDVERYPDATVRLRVFSLSTQEGWIGV